MYFVKYIVEAYCYYWILQLFTFHVYTNVTHGMYVFYIITKQYFYSENSAIILKLFK